MLTSALCALLPQTKDRSKVGVSEVCHAVGTEPCMQPATGEELKHRTANREDGARMDIVAQNFWGSVHYLMFGY